MDHLEVPWIVWCFWALTPTTQATKNKDYPAKERKLMNGGFINLCKNLHHIPIEGERRPDTPPEWGFVWEKDFMKIIVIVVVIIIIIRKNGR